MHEQNAQLDLTYRSVALEVVQRPEDIGNDFLVGGGALEAGHPALYDGQQIGQVL